MILSNLDIQAAIDQGNLRIHPEPLPRQPTLDKPDCPYGTTSVDLSLSDELQIPLIDKPFTFDLRRGGIAPFLAENTRRVTIDPDGGFALNPKQFILGRTVENVALPIVDGPCLAARVEGKSSFARCGLIVHFTAPTIHAGFEGTITLEMINLGAYPIMLYPRLRICQLIIEAVSGKPFTRPSQFHGQSHPAGTK